MNKKPETMDDEKKGKSVDLFEALKNSLKEIAAEHDARENSESMDEPSEQDK